MNTIMQFFFFCLFFKWLCKLFDQRGLDIPPSFNFQCLPLCLQYKTQNSFREDNLRVADEDGGRFGSERVNAPQKREGKKRIMEIKSCMSRDQA